MYTNAIIQCIRSSKLRRFNHSAILAHEMRNPLCNINLSLEMLDKISLDEEIKMYLDIIRRGSIRIKELLSDLLMPVRAKEVTFEFYSLHQLLDEVLILAKDRAALKKIAISRENNATEHKVFLDGEKMKIALTNIVINAIDAMPSEGGELKLVIKSTDQLSSLEIQDNGIGISKGNLKRIFEPYFTNKPGGMGLGLSTTLDILRANHTGIEVRSEEGLGTCFTLSFERR